MGGESPSYSVKNARESCGEFNSKFDFVLTDCAERELLPHQDAKIKDGLEKAIQHKDKLLEFDRNRCEVKS